MGDYIPLYQKYAICEIKNFESKYRTQCTSTQSLGIPPEIQLPILDDDDKTNRSITGDKKICSDFRLKRKYNFFSKYAFANITDHIAPDQKCTKGTFDLLLPLTT